MSIRATTVSLPEESHGQRSLVGYHPWGRKELDTTERLSSHSHDDYWRMVFSILSCQGFELKQLHSLKSRYLTSFRIPLLLPSMCYLNEHLQHLLGEGAVI